MARGFLFLTAVLDWHGRRVLAHRVSITTDADFRIETLQEALAQCGKPQIMNTGPRCSHFAISPAPGSSTSCATTASTSA
jgi:hypothetical protein